MINAYDIETFIDKKTHKHIAYCVVFLLNKQYYTFYYNEKDIVAQSVQKMFDLVKKNEIFYVHNLNFDGMLILNSLSNQSIIKFDVFIRDLNIYSISLLYRNKKIIF